MGARILGAQDQAAFAPAALTGFQRVTAIALDALRHALPLVPFYLRRGNVTAYLLLTAFDLSLGLMLIVGTTRERGDRTTVDPRATWLALRLTAVLLLGIFLGLVAQLSACPWEYPPSFSARRVGWTGRRSCRDRVSGCRPQSWPW